MYVYKHKLTELLVLNVVYSVTWILKSIIGSFQFDCWVFCGFL